MDHEVKSRLRWVTLYAQTGDASLVCRRCGVSRPTLRKWWHRFTEHGPNGLRSKSRRPLRSPAARVQPQHEQWILELRRERNLGARRIQSEYRRWDQSPSFEGKTLCTGVFRDGQRQVFLGVVPSEAVSATSVELGTVEFRVVSQQPVSLTEDDFALVTADIVEATSQRVLQMPLSGNAGRVMTLEPPTYHNELAQNYPNPFNPSTTIAFSIEKTEQVRLELVDVRGAMNPSACERKTCGRESPGSVGR